MFCLQKNNRKIKGEKMVKIILEGKTIETERHKSYTINNDNPVIKAIKQQAREDVLKKYDKVVQSLASK